jgi:hypothetical protein
MKDIMLFEEYWGNLILSVCIGKIDVLPRVTLSAFPGAFIINVGFIFFTLNLTLWDEQMREFNRRNAQKGHN